MFIFYKMWGKAHILSKKEHTIVREVKECVIAHEIA